MFLPLVIKILVIQIFSTITTINGQSDNIKVNMKMYYNRTIAIDVINPIVLTMEMLPSNQSIMVTVTTRTFLIAYFVTGPGIEEMPPEWKKTSSISNELKRLGIRNVTVVAYEEGYWAVMEKRFWNLLDKKITLRVFDYRNKENVVETIQNITIHNYRKCTPNVLMQKGMEPFDPNNYFHVSFAFSALVYYENPKRCEGNLSLYYFWKLSDIVESVTYKRFITKSKTIQWPRSFFRFEAAHKLYQNEYVLEASVIFNGVVLKSRRYISVIMGKVEALIAGGLYREIAAHDIVFMNASQSRDYSKLESEEQFSTYEWKCYEIKDSKKRKCNIELPNTAAFEVPAGTFGGGEHHIFTVTVASDLEPNVKSSYTQTVFTVDRDVLYLRIVCKFNCDHMEYDPMHTIILEAHCKNAKRLKPRYEWFMEDISVGEDQRIVLKVPEQQTSVYIRLHGESKDGRYAEIYMYLKAIPKPMDGKCTINPKEGIEARTAFKICCYGYNSKYAPFQYFYYANRVLIDSGYDCEYVNLPIIDKVMVNICDVNFVCSEYELPVSVKPATDLIIEPPKALTEFLRKTVVADLNKGKYTSAHAMISSVASRLHELDGYERLLNIFNYYQPQDIESLGKMANLTIQLGINLSPINPQDMGLLVRTLIELNKNFQRLHDDGSHEVLIKQPYRLTTSACVEVYNVMKKLTKGLGNPAASIYKKYKEGPLTQELIDELHREINEITDPRLRKMNRVWLDAHWETEKLYKLLGFARENGLQATKSYGDIVTDGVAFQLECFLVQPNVARILCSSDAMHSVILSYELLRELKPSSSDRLCVKIISRVRKLRWWYPEEKQPSSTVLSVHVYHDRDNFKHEYYIENPISFTTITGKYKPFIDKYGSDNDSVEMQQTNQQTSQRGYNQNSIRRRQANEVVTSDDNDNVELPPQHEFIDEDEKASELGKYRSLIVTGELKYLSDIRIYRVSLGSLEMLAVNFINCTHKLRVLLSTQIQPLRTKISKSKCYAVANQTSQFMLLRNLCTIEQRAYISFRVWSDDEDVDKPGVKELILDGPAYFNFVIELRACDHWIYSLPADDQHWSSLACRPSLDYRLENGMHCKCNWMSSYTSYVFNVPAIPVITEDAVRVVKINWLIVIFYAIVMISVILWLLWLCRYRNEPIVKLVGCKKQYAEDLSLREPHDLLVFIKTGGGSFADTTSDVTISFITTSRHEVQFTILQDPENPTFTINSTHGLWLRTRDIRLPTKIAISLIPLGRYPSWYLRRIELHDMQTNEVQVFAVDRWIRNKVVILESKHIFKLGDTQIVGTWKRRFCSKFESLFINWGMFQPLFGTWHGRIGEPCLTRFQRVCVFVSKTAVTYCIIAIYLGPTTWDSIETERHTKKDLYDFTDVIATSVIGYLGSCLVQTFFDLVLIRYYSE